MKRGVSGKRTKCSQIPAAGVVSINESKKEDKVYIKIVTKDLIRDLIVRNEKPKVYSAVLSHDKFKDIIKRSKVLTPEERWQLVLKREEENAKKLAESQVRKEDAHRWESVRQKGEKLSKIDQEAALRTNYILTRAELLKAEQEDEVKAANRLILSTKCHAIRCAQIAEKSLTRKELEKEERRLENMMEQERLHLIACEEKKREEERLKKMKYVEYVKQQIQENEAQKVILAQKLEQESKLIKKSMIQSNLEAIEGMKKKIEDQAKMRAELHAINEQLLLLKRIEQEEEIMADLKIQEYMRQKAEREAEREAELMRMKQAREKEIARLRALQERQQDLQAKEDDLKAKRIQEEVEREWRRKERELAKRHAKEEENLKKARQTQIEQRKRMQAIDVALEKREFDRILAAQIEETEKLKQNEERKKQNNTEHRATLLNQINDKVGERERQRQRVFEEGVAIALEEEKRQQRLRNVMKNKVEELRIHKVPEVYIKEIERQLKIADPKD